MSAFDDDAYRKKAEEIAETLQEYSKEKEGWHVAKKTVREISMYDFHS